MPNIRSAAPAPRQSEAATLYARGVELLYRSDYVEADKVLTAVKTEHPYSRYAALAELRLAEADQRQGRHLEAIELYRAFLRFHPGHDQADYARLQMAESHYAQLPVDLAWLPPSAEKDQGTTRAAIAAYREFLRRQEHLGESSAISPSSIARAKEHLAACRRRLADHEIYVAKFYLRAGRFAAAASRAEVVLEKFMDVGLAPEALWLAGSARAHLGDAAQAQLHLQRLVADHPKALQSHAARALLKHLAAEDPPA